MKFLKSFLILAIICGIHANKVEYDDIIKDIEELNNIDFGEIQKEAKFTVKIDEKDEHISKSTGIYDELMDEIEGINDDSENTRDRLIVLQEESSTSNWGGLTSSIKGVMGVIFDTAGNMIDAAVNQASDKGTELLSATLNYLDRVHTQKKLFIAKVQKCTEQQGLSIETISADAYAQIETCIPVAVASINATTQTMIEEVRNVRNFMSKQPIMVDECMQIMRNSSDEKGLAKIGASGKTVFCLSGVASQVGVEVAQLSTKMTTCGVKAVVSFHQIQRELRFCYLDGMEAIVKEAKVKGVDLSKCVLRNETKNHVE